MLALEILAALDRVAGTPARGSSLEGLDAGLRVDSLQLEPVLETLAALDWVGQLQEDRATEGARWVLLVNPDQQTLGPLAERLLLQHAPSTEAVWKSARLANLMLREAL